ncbi:thioredoxin domain-containing protein [Paenibacillus melissococcoides]|uniref:Thioredoxin n=1 Tax=Paenibacillus melissococcoides TaxID=2912268 RepID=A0ABM9G8K0_9BACL|nr:MULTISPECIES: thioredoxin domain-containing protein [Paenibacillus]MEB9897038.1 thioredoxin domain-containing protein [Bacillus cereus]CAH8247988.1 thioredoxin domain-containing protein [Paenibacillus melissococcoides]CAH8718946.1 thioredoxin domain-containing protein [Paenibacillus melissococcoides]CAH8719952.1 thioredoxin domain-containing protein [Paenibacillus melissococcoides]GIO80685.1 thioredoxin [Paenibacillus dendritiformis]
MPVVELTDATFEEHIRKHPIVLVEFWAPWCKPCQAMAPVLEQLAAEAEGRASIAACNADVNFVAAVRYQLQGIPWLVVFKEGREVARKAGTQPVSVLLGMIESAHEADY